MPHFSFSSLRVRLILLVVAAAVPGLALILYEISEQQELSLVVAEQNAMHVAHEVSSNHKRILEGAHQFLTGLAQLPNLRNPDAGTCSALLNDILKQLPTYKNLGVLRTTGDLSCSARPFDAPAIFAAHPYYKEALRTGVPAVSGYRINGESNLVYVYPLVGRPGIVQTVLFVEFGFDWFSRLFTEAKLAQGSVITIRDQSGTVLARYPDGDKWVGKTASDVAIYKAILAQKGQGKAEAKGADGILRYYVFMPMGAVSGNTGLTVSVGIPKEVLFAGIKRTFIRDFTLLFIVGVLTVVGALVIGESLIRREVGDLLGATERLGTGDLKARIGPTYRKGELGRLAYAFDSMAEALQRLHDQLIENERLAAIGTTSAKFAHEIANPLNGMAMTTQLLQRYLARQGSLSDEKVSSALQTINNEIQHLRALLDEFRSLYRRENYNFQPTLLATVIKEVLALESPEYMGRGIQVEQACPEDLPLVMADREKLKQALLNLCRNAAEAMPNGGKMIVRVRSSGDQVILEVEDTGTGIPDGIDILEPFATTKASGTGLGLVIVRQIVAAHKGTMTYASEPDRGATFRLILPQHPLSNEAT
jgi:signal transduction histidine kinase